MVRYNRIKAELAEHNKKSEELSKYMNVHATTVSDWCTNKNQPSIPDLYRIAEFLQIDVRLLLISTADEYKFSMVAEDAPAIYKRNKPSKKTSKRK
ncbi:MAG: helix-turn-helix transcriptional regulator [Sphingobacteriales bacterium]|nr:helix-turn-helix transcriptional regulator [Sphingobacteriales bacterium]MBI3717388.1 helix-turn-helix transcriptional regulator [Sphingobacteriales bacterium]